jgi:methionyl-tRNA formyltransferase
MHWALRMGDDKTGVSIFWVDEGIDTGAVLLQKDVDIGPDDTVGSLYFDRLFPLGVESMVEAVRLVREGNAPRIVQDETLATYEPPADDGNSGIDWSKPAVDVYNLIRGSNPTPGAHARLRGQMVRIFDARMTDDAPGQPPGTVLATGETIDVALAGGLLHVQRAQQAGSKKIAAAEFASAAKISAADRFDDGTVDA